MLGTSPCDQMGANFDALFQSKPQAPEETAEVSKNTEVRRPLSIDRALCLRQPGASREILALKQRASYPKCDMSRHVLYEAVFGDQ